LILSQRGVFFDYTTISELIETAAYADVSGQYKSVWVGDSILAVQRPESLTLLGAMASRTERIQLATGCLASMPIRDPVLLAAQWSTLDHLSAGRMLLTVCLGIAKACAASEREGAIYGVPDRDRAGRLEENMQVLRRLWTEDDVSFEGKYMQLREVTLKFKPVQSPPPIYIASQPVPGDKRAEPPLRRLAKFADGWMTARKNPDSITRNLKELVGYLEEEGRSLDNFPVVAYQNVNLNPHRRAAWDESQRFIEAYYGPIFSREDIEGWTAAGTVAQVIDDLNLLFDEGATHVALRVSSWEWRTQLELLTEEVLPALRRN
jgi:alkanesulfonate monooxygenase SsuD/methylene tetrahydromethanopterin reductase-like flavin-dependent oxidoreductase (luciferase family)